MRHADLSWKKLAPQSLGAYLLARAKYSSMEQALLHRVIGGYLKQDELAMDTSEIPPSRLPQCLELVGTEETLQEFLRVNVAHLQKVRKVFLRGKEAAVEAAIAKQELEQILDI